MVSILHAFPIRFVLLYGALWHKENLLKHLHGAPVLTGRVVEDIWIEICVKVLSYVQISKLRRTLHFVVHNVMILAESEEHQCWWTVSGIRSYQTSTASQHSKIASLHWSKELMLVYIKGFLSKSVEWVHSYFLIKWICHFLIPKLWKKNITVCFHKSAWLFATVLLD